MKDRIIIVNSNCYHGYDFYRAMEGIKKAGFHYTELTSTVGWTEHVSVSESFKDLLDKKRFLESSKIVPLGFSGHTNLMDSARIPDFINNIELAHFFGSKYIVSSVGEAHIKDRRTTGDDELIENISSFMDLIEKYDMFFSIETHGEHSRAERIKKITDRIKSDRIGICYDTANAIFYGDVEGTEDVKAACSDINYLHIKDKAGGRKEWNFPALGDGYVDFLSIFSVLDENGNSAPLSIEIEFTEKGSSSAEEVDEALARSADYLKSLGYTL